MTQDIFPDELVTRIAKYVYLQSLGLEEKTIADYIGMNGFPAVVNSKLDLQIKDLQDYLVWNLFRLMMLLWLI